ncbi:hypothetical protein AVEN_2218-1 [Araneus ventricosus]|uniref:Uncharacterized protein n=1 Tax=Araneus ventricosus TaxID=182803 RepID=A0A4Y2KB69_ARAVE|nr:hypothetical protein AVEN_2218-1 [Araneus ventricosus]
MINEASINPKFSLPLPLWLYADVKCKHTRSTNTQSTVTNQVLVANSKKVPTIHIVRKRPASQILAPPDGNGDQNWPLTDCACK